MDTRMIGLWGRLGTGKSTVAALLVARHGFQEFAYADPLKDLARDLFAFDEHTLRGPSDARNVPDARGSDPAFWQQVVYRAHVEHRDRILSLFAACPTRLRPWEIMGQLTKVLVDLEALGGQFTARVALQQLGTEFGRELWPQIWLEAAMARIALNHAHRIVIPDVRFPNEADLVTRHGGEVWWIDASRRVTPNAFAHVSEALYEQAAPHITRVLDNNGTLEQTAQRVAHWVGEGMEGCAA